MTQPKDGIGAVKTGILLVAIVIMVNGAMLSYGFIWNWIRSTGFVEQNTAGIKPQEGPGAAAVVSAAVSRRGPGIKLTTKNDSRQLVSPITPSIESMNRGEESYARNCSPCHGEDGDGYGIMGAVPQLVPASAAEVEEKRDYFKQFLLYRPEIDASFALSMTDGELYWTITKGGESIMPGYADALSSDDRWDLINYIKYGLGGKRE